MSDIHNLTNSSAAASTDSQPGDSALASTSSAPFGQEASPHAAATDASPTPDGTSSEAAAAEAPAVHASTSKVRDSIFGTRNLMTIAAIAVVASLIIVPVNYLFAAIAVSPKGILIACVLMGIWYYPYALAGAVTRKPGAIMISALIIGIIGTFTTPSGAAAIAGNLFGGLLIELGLIATLYRRWTLGFIIGAFIFGGFNGSAFGWVMKQGTGLSFALLAGAIAIASCLIALLLLRVTVKALNKAGVGKGHTATPSAS